MRTILVVDPVPEYRSAVADIIRQLGHRVVTAANADECKGTLLTVRPDLVMIEFYLGTERGDDLCRELVWRGIKTIVMMAAVNDPMTVAASHDAGALDFLHKPFD